MSLSENDLKNTIHNIITLDDFKPKAGNDEEVIVVTFYFNDEGPARDLNTFIQRGFIDILDVEVSPNTDEDGRYLVFIEMDRNKTFPEKFKALVKDIENLTGKVDWKIKTYLSDDKEFEIGDKKIFKFIILDPKEYVTKEEFKMATMKEGVVDFFKSSMVANLTTSSNYVILMQGQNKIIAEVVDFGDYDSVIGRNFLSESAFKLTQIPYEIKMLESMLGNCGVTPLDKFVLLTRDNDVMLLKNTHISYDRTRD